MKHIVIISASIRKGRLSHRIALFLKKHVEEHHQATAEILDLKEYNFPLFEERLMYYENPTSEMVDFAERFVRANGVIVVSPVYNSGYTAAFKNIVDFFVDEWKDKVTAVCSVTYGNVPGISTVTQMQALLLKLGALVSPLTFTVTNAETTFDEGGNSQDEEVSHRRATVFVGKFLKLVEQTTI